MDYDNDISVNENLLTVLGFPEFEPLRRANINISAVVAIKMTKHGEEEATSGDLVKLKKCAPLFEFLTQKQFVLVACKFRWYNIDDNAKQALLHKALMAIELDEDGKIKRRSADVTEYGATVSRYGAYTEGLRDFQRTLVERDHANLVEAVSNHPDMDLAE